MDDLARFNQQRWDALAAANIAYSRPILDLNIDAAREKVDPHDVLGDVTGQRVLCLASGGGQQSVAFGLLGADVTVFDLSATQLARDREAAAHYGLSVRTVQGDMRDLSVFADNAFDIVWQAYSINFVPNPRPVLAEVARVLRPGGLFRIEFMNPFTGVLEESEWRDRGYPLRRRYGDGELVWDDDLWDVEQEDGSIIRVPGPREFSHSMSTMINTLVANRLQVIGFWEVQPLNPNAAPGTWEHLVAVAPPWLQFWCRLDLE
ncbi:MAG: class I SAM-dependent methyltransferase [Anaerolineae bacterium]|nr:class I SAM-dependent methyltransferase [Anaerolineae bacterium]